MHSPFVEAQVQTNRAAANQPPSQPFSFWTEVSAPAKPVSMPTPDPATLSASQLTQAQMIDLVRTTNPQVLAARQQAVAAQSAVRPAIAPDNPQLNVIELPIARNPLAIGASQGLQWSLMQPVSWPGKKRLAGEVAQAQADAASYGIATIVVALVGQLRTTIAALQLLNKQIKLTSDNLIRLDSVKKIAQLRYAQNAAAFVDFINAQVAESSARNDLFGFQQQARIATATINTLIGREPSAPLTVIDEAPPDRLSLPTLAALKLKALDTNPQIAASAASVRAAEHALDLAKLGVRPDFNVGVYGISGSPPFGFANNQNWGFEVDVRIPLYAWMRERPLIDQAGSLLAAARNSDDALRQQVLLGVETAYRQVEQSLQQTELLRTRVVEQARVAYRLALTNYGTGTASFLDVSNTLLALRASELALAQAEVSIVQAQASLDAAVGTEPGSDASSRR
jgi:outer membrane protein TolC